MESQIDLNIKARTSTTITAMNIYCWGHHGIKEDKSKGDFISTAYSTQSSHATIKELLLPRSLNTIALLLDQKKLSQTDVGKLNRLVVPKRLALKFLPDIPATRNADQPNSREVVFYDKQMKAWEFKYSYWTANRTLVFTKGWKKFVNSKNLKKGDLVKFYVCKNPAKPAEDFLMIETQAGSIKLLGVTIYLE
ncbi:hypothetical protein ACFE04_010019 [Oxalis oulophora]